jgi:uncharacterized peroxidase-related enzyme
MYLQTIDEAEAIGDVAEVYRRVKTQTGFIMEATQCWSTRPEIMKLWLTFFDHLKSRLSISQCDWRLITFVAAQRIPSTYCSLVYGRQLVDDLGSEEKVLAVQKDFRAAGLSERDVAMLAYAEKVSANAASIAEADIEDLRAAGLDDAEIFDIALCAGIRCFLSRFFDAVGAEPDALFRDMDADFRDPLVVGKPLAGTASACSADPRRA